MPESAYIHIPFCKTKCRYCSFVSGVNTERIPEYVNLLLENIENCYKGEKLKTLYFGGGTPSLLQICDIEKIMSKFEFAHNAEITFEVNPDDGNIDYFKALYNCGINRISMGAQSFDDKVLKLIGRRHRSEETISAVKSAQKAGFKNISLDLIYGLPNADIKKDLNEILKLDIQHISTYGLKIEEGSFFYTHMPDKLPDEDMQADMYLLVNDTLENAGYKRYEVSNFAIPGYESRHNLNYWNNKEYYGFGLAAHGYVNKIRYANYKSFNNYAQNSYIPEFEHFVTNQENLEEEIFLGLRKECGIDINEINRKFKINFEEKYSEILKKYIPVYIEKTPSGIKFTIEGVLLSNIILADFLNV